MKTFWVEYRVHNSGEKHVDPVDALDGTEAVQQVRGKFRVRVTVDAVLVRENESRPRRDLRKRKG